MLPGLVAFSSPDTSSQGCKAEYADSPDAVNSIAPRQAKESPRFLDIKGPKREIFEMALFSKTFTLCAPIIFPVGKDSPAEDADCGADREYRLWLRICQHSP